MNQPNNASNACDAAIKDINEKIKQTQNQKQSHNLMCSHEIRDPYGIFELMRSRL